MSNKKMFSRGEEQQKIEDTIKRLEKIIKQSGIKNVDMDAIREASFARRHAKLEKMRDIITEARALGADKAIIKSWVEDDVVVDGGELGLGKVEYAWNKFVAMYFRYANPRDQVSPDPIRGKLVGVFRGIGDFVAWLLTEEMRYSGFWQGVIKNFANSWFGVINGYYAKLWIPETSPLSWRDDDGTLWVIPEVTAEYLDETHTTTREIKRPYAFKCICYNRQTKQWENPAPEPGNKPFVAGRMANIYNIETITSYFRNEASPAHGLDTDDMYWNRYTAEMTQNVALHNYSQCAPEDFYTFQSDYTNDDGTTYHNRNRLSFYDLQIYSEAIADDTAPNNYSAILQPFNEVVTFGYDFNRGHCSYKNIFTIISIAKEGWPPIVPRYRIIAIATAQVAPIFGYPQWDRRTWWVRTQNQNDGDHNVASTLPIIREEHESGDIYYMTPIGLDRWIGLEAEPDVSFFPPYDTMTVVPNCMGYDGFKPEEIHIGSSSCYAADQIVGGDDIEYNGIFYTEARAGQNEGTCHDVEGGTKDMNFFIIEKYNVSQWNPSGYHYKEAYAIKKMGTIYAEYTVPIHGTQHSNDYWMIGYSFNVGSDTRYKYFNESDNPSGQQWNWTVMSRTTIITADIEIPEGTLRQEIFLSCNQSVGCEREQQVAQKITIISPKIARVEFRVRSRHNVSPSHTRRWTYFILWPVGRVPVTREDRVHGIMHPTCDNQYGPSKDSRPGVRDNYVGRVTYEDD